MCKLKTRSLAICWKTYQKSNAIVYLTCEHREFEDPFSSEKTMYFTEQVATVEEFHHIGSKTDFTSIKFIGHDVRMQNHTGSSVTIIATQN